MEEPGPGSCSQLFYTTQVTRLAATSSALFVCSVILVMLQNSFQIYLYSSISLDDLPVARSNCLLAVKGVRARGKIAKTTVYCLLRHKQRRLFTACTDTVSGIAATWFGASKADNLPTLNGRPHLAKFRSPLSQSASFFGRFAAQ